jgi:hypothetical protein
MSRGAFLNQQRDAMTIDKAAIYIPEIFVDQEAVTLSRPISAIQLIAKEGCCILGPLAQLRPGTAVQRCGGGFNDETTKVRANGQCYFVFVEDVESQTAAAFGRHLT